MTDTADEVWVNFDPDEIKRAVLGDCPYAARISTALIFRLLRLRSQKEDIYVLRAIDKLEGLPSDCRTKPEEQLKGQVLGRFWHKHFVTSRDSFLNIGEHWGITRKGGQWIVKGRKLDTLIERVAQKDEGNPEEWLNILSDKFARGYEWRREAGRLTGNWIIFGKHQGKNYYLDLATHEEAYDDPWRLYGKLRAGSQAEFPFLFS